MGQYPAVQVFAVKQGDRFSICRLGDIRPGGQGGDAFTGKVRPPERAAVGVGFDGNKLKVAVRLCCRDGFGNLPALVRSAPLNLDACDDEFFAFDLD